MGKEAVGERQAVSGRVGEAGRSPLVSWLAARSWMGKRSSHEAWVSLWSLGRGGGGLWPNLVHNWGGKRPPCALGMLSFKKFMNLLTHPVLLCGSSLFRRMILRAVCCTRLFLWSPLLLMPSSLFLGWIYKAINQSSRSKENPVKMEKAGIWQTLPARFQLTLQLNFSGTHGVIHISFPFRGLPHGFWPVFALYVVCSLHGNFSWALTPGQAPARLWRCSCK